MKILYIALSCGPIGGSEDAIGWNLPCEMTRRGHEVTVLTREDKRAEIEGYITEHPGDGPYPGFEYEALSAFEAKCVGPLYSVRAKSWCGRIGARVKELDARRSYDIVHQITPVEYRSPIDFSGIGALTAIGPVGGGGEMPRCLTGYLQPKDRAQELFRSAMNWQANHSPSVRRAYRTQQLVLAANGETAEILRGGVGLDRHIPIHSEVAVKLESPAVRGSKPLAGCAGGSSRHGYVVGAAGRLHYRKGYKLLLEAFARMGLQDATLRIAGDGAQRAELGELAQELGVAERVEFLGGVDYQQMRDFYAGLDLFAFPSLRETTGTVMVEALAMGLPVLALDIFGARQFLSHEQGFLVSCEGTREEVVARYAEAMQRLLLSEKRPDVSPEELTWAAQCAWCEGAYAAASRAEAHVYETAEAE